MKKPSDESLDWEDQRMKIIGLGESSIRKSYYPELQQRLTELEEKNTDLLDALEMIQQKEEELRQNYDELRIIQSALDMARKKLNLLNTITFQDLQSALFSMNGYLSLARELVDENCEADYLEKSLQQIQKMERVLRISKQFQNLGIHPPKWQPVLEVYVYAISHLDLSSFDRDIRLDGLELFADPLLEDALFYLFENLQIHSRHATMYRFWFEQSDPGLTLVLEDNGIGIEPQQKENIFDRGTGMTGGIGLFLVREILSITEMVITERGEYQKGARFEIFVPSGMFRITHTG